MMIKTEGFRSFASLCGGGIIIVLIGWILYLFLTTRENWKDKVPYSWVQNFPTSKHKLCTQADLYFNRKSKDLNRANGLDNKKSMLVFITFINSKKEGEWM